MRIEDLNGLMRITYHWDPPENLPPGSFVVPLTTAYVVVYNGRFAGIDVGGASCTGAFRLIGESRIEAESTWSAERADSDVYLYNNSGAMTRGPVNYKGTFNIQKNSNGYVGTGVVSAGPIEIEVFLEHLEKFDVEASST